MPIPRVNLHPATGWLWVERPSDNLQQVEHTSRFVPVHVTRAASTWINHARPQACPGCTCHWPCSSWQGAHDAQDCADPKKPTHTDTHVWCTRAMQQSDTVHFPVQQQSSTKWGFMHPCFDTTPHLQNTSTRQAAVSDSKAALQTGVPYGKMQVPPQPHQQQSHSCCSASEKAHEHTPIY
jgi:hypothetical protein